MFKLERKKEFLQGSIAGIIAAIIKYIFNELMQFLKLAKYDNNATALGMVLKTWENNIIYWTFGFILALFVGAFFGVIIAFIFRYILNENYYLFKGAGIGIGIFLLNFGVFSKVFNYPPDMQSSLGDVISMLLSLILYGVVTVYMLKILGFFPSQERPNLKLVRKIK